MRIFVVVSLIALCSCKEPAPMPEYAEAMARYQETVARTLDPSHMHADFAGVAAMLRAVPTRNKREHARAQQLAEMIETAQAQRAEFLSKASAPLPAASLVPTSSGGPTLDPPPPPPQRPDPMTKDYKKAFDDCIKESNKRFESCLKGCHDDCTVDPDGTFRCSVKTPEQQQQVAKCAQDCRPKDVKCKT